MRHTNLTETAHRGTLSKLARYAGIVVVIMTAFMTTSCSKEKEPTTSEALVGTWTFSESSVGDDGDVESLKMTLKFNKNNTGSIIEEWISESRATGYENYTYTMNFSWSATSDAYGNDILRISYVSGDKNTELFYGSDYTVLWNRQYVLTGKILNIYDGDDGVWVFNKK